MISGENKNRYTMAYFLWRTMNGLHQKITFHTQVAYHGRCLVDSGFAYIKKKYRHKDVDSLPQLRDVVDESATSNQAVLFQGPDGWVWRDWKSFLSRYFKPLNGISKLHHFTFDADKPGMCLEIKESLTYFCYNVNSGSASSFGIFVYISSFCLQVLSASRRSSIHHQKSVISSRWTLLRSHQ